jgi:integrase
LSDRLYRKSPGGPWYGWIYVGRRQIRFCTYATDRRAALAVLKERERAALDPTYQAAHPTPHSLGHALAWFLSHGCHAVADATREMYRQKAGHAARLMGSVDVNALTIDHVSHYIEARTDEGAAPETIRKEIVTLRRALALAHQRRLMRENPRNLFPEYRVRYKPRTRYLAAADAVRLFAELEPARQLWVLVACYTGARASEVEAITWECIDLARGVVLLPGTKTQKSRRHVPLHPALVSVLGAVPRLPGPIVPAWGNALRDLGRACERAGLERLNRNDLRRTFASWLKQEGVDSMVVAKLMGHSTSRMVELVYGQLTGDTYRNAVALLPAGDTSVIKSAAELPTAAYACESRGGDSSTGERRARPDSNGRPADSKSGGAWGVTPLLRATNPGRGWRR